MAAESGRDAEGVAQAPSLSATILEPPHYREVPARAKRSRSDCGVVALVRVAGEDVRPARLPHTLDFLRRWGQAHTRIPPVCTIPTLEGLSPPECHYLFRLLPTAAVVVAPTCDIHMLRSVLTDPRLVPERIRAWLRTHVSGSTPWQSQAIELVQAGLAAPPDAPLPAWVGPVSWSSTEGPSPNRWYRLGKAVRAALKIQRRTDLTVSEAAFALGYHDGSSLSRQLHEVFGRRPSFIRPRLGWWWLLDDWRQKHDVPRQCQPPKADMTGFL